MSLAPQIDWALDKIYDEDAERDRHVRPFSWLGEPGIDAELRELVRGIAALR